MLNLQKSPLLMVLVLALSACGGGDSADSASVAEESPDEALPNEQDPVDPDPDPDEQNPEEPELEEQAPVLATAPIKQGPSTAHFCVADSALVGGVFTDSDGTASRIDDVSTRHMQYALPETQSDYREWLENGHPLVMDGNLHGFGYNALGDLKQHGWPEAAHLLLRHLQANGRVSEVFTSDAVSAEGMNYHFLWLGGMQSLAAGLEGYQDPDNWTPPPGVKKITRPLTHVDIFPPSKRFNQYVTNGVKVTLPDGTDSGANDTGIQQHNGHPSNLPGWGAGGLHFGYSIEQAAKSYLLGGAGQLGLGEGTLDEKNQQVQSLLHFSTKDNGHVHNDTLMFGLFGNGRNLLSFPGHQNQSHGPENKNLVMVDATWQNHYISDLAGRLEIYAPMPAVKFARVDATHIIHGGNPNGTGRTPDMDRYRRTIVQNTIDLEKAYTLDIFEIAGGGQHDYLMRGSGVLQQNYPSTSLDLGPGSMAIADSNTAKFSGTQKASFAANESFWVDLTFKDDPSRGSRSHFPSQGAAGELYLNNMEEAWTFTSGGLGEYVPQYTLHRSGAQPLQSTFVAVHEVLDGSGRSFIQSVTRQSLDADSISVTVTLENGRVDTYLVSFAGRKNMIQGAVSADAVIAAHSSFNGDSELWLVGGETASDGRRVLNASRSEVTGSLVEIHREADGAPSDFLDSDISLPVGYELHGQTILVEHFDQEDDLIFVNSYGIDYVENVCGYTRIHVDNEPGIRQTNSGIKEVFHPRRPKSKWSNFGIGNTVARSQLRFVNSKTTVPHITVMSPGREDPEARIQAQVGLAIDHNQAIKLNTHPLGAQISYEVNGSGNYELSSDGLVSLTGDSTVRYKVGNPDGFVEAPEREESYYKPLPALSGTLSNPGLWAEKWSGWTYNFDRNDPLNSFDFGRWTGENKVVKTLSYAEVDFAKHAAGSGARVSGYFQAPESGLYRFYTRMDAAVKLSIDGKPIIQENGMRRSPQWVGEVYLESGAHEIEVWQFAKTKELFSVNIEGPGIPFGDIPESLLFQNLD